MKYTILIDYSHLFHIARSMAIQAPPPYSIIDSIAFHLQGKLRTLDRIFDNLQIHQCDMVFVEDRPAIRKLQLLPTYRQGRENLSEEKSKVKSLLKEKGCQGYWCYSEGNEADDTIATLAKMATSNGQLVIICTGDKDIWQLISPSISILNPIKKEIVRPENVQAAFDVSPNQIPLYKAFWGDSGDCVPNVMPRMKRYLLPIIRLSNGTFDDCHQKILAYKNKLTEKCFLLYNQQEANIRRNYSLVKLDSQCPLQWD